MIDNRDKILKFLSENRRSHFDQRELQKKLLTDLNVDEVKDLLRQIINYNPDLMRVYNESKTGVLPVEYSGLIDNFLSNGGFTSIESDLKNTSEKQDEQEKLEEQIRKLTIDNLRLDNWDIRFRWYIAVIGFIIGFITKYIIDK